MALSPQDQAGRQRTATFLGLLDSASLLPGQTVVNLYSLRQLCLQGVPENPDWLRAQAWKALLSYLPTEKRDWARTLKARRTEYYVRIYLFVVSIRNSVIFGGHYRSPVLLTAIPARFSATIS